MAEANHEYHLVDPSPWPAVGATSCLVMAFGGIGAMHGWPYFGMVFAAGLIGVFYTMYEWWADVVEEGEFQGHHSPTVQIGLRYGMILFIASEVMFFLAWFWAYFNASLFPAPQEGLDFITRGTEGAIAVWPPNGIETFDPWHIPFINTLVLLLSGTTVTWAHHAIVHGDRKGLIQGLTLTVILGISFSALQAYEYVHAAFGFSGNIYGSTFFMATGFHGAHVIIGTIFLAVCLVRARLGHFKPDHHFGLEAAAWYWHFVDVVWLFLFSCIYVWGAGTIAAH